MRQEDESQPIPQAAALPIKDGQVCLIRSSSGKQWGIPKGHIEPNETAEATAIREAWEEAGLVGTITREAIGRFRYEKCGRTYEVTVFGMEVAELPRAGRKTIDGPVDGWPHAGARNAGSATASGDTAGNADRTGRIDSGQRRGSLRLRWGGDSRRQGDAKRQATSQAIPCTLKRFHSGLSFLLKPTGRRGAGLPDDA